MTIRRSTTLKKLQNEWAFFRDCNDRPGMARVAKEIERITKSAKEPIVSEHALLRYLQNVKGVDLRAIENEMLNGRRQIIMDTPSGRIKLPDGTTMIFENNVIKTVFKPKRNRRVKRKRR